MQEDPQVAEHKRRLNLDPRNFDPRKALDPASLERVIKAQALARAQAAATTQVLLGTIVTLITSAFGFVAALAWNSVIQTVLNDNINSGFLGKNPPNWAYPLVYAAIVTLVAVFVVVGLNRIAGRIAKRSVIEASGN